MTCFWTEIICVKFRTRHKNHTWPSPSLFTCKLAEGKKAVGASEILIDIKILDGSQTVHMENYSLKNEVEWDVNRKETFIVSNFLL